MTTHGAVHTPAPLPWEQMTPDMRKDWFDQQWELSRTAASRRPQPTAQELTAHLKRLAVARAQERAAARTQAQLAVARAQTRQDAPHCILF